MYSVHDPPFSGSLVKETVKWQNLYFLLSYGFTQEQSEPVGTCEKQRNCCFSLSIPYAARLAGACS